MCIVQVHAQGIRIYGKILSERKKEKRGFEYAKKKKARVKRYGRRADRMNEKGQQAEEEEDKKRTKGKKLN